MKSTKKSLLMSTLSLILCVAMLLGTTYAWFTDSVTSGKNKIVAGNLDIELEYLDGEGNWKPVTESTKLFNDSALWEPGYTEVAYLRLSNKGTLALKYNFAINIANEVAGTNMAGETFKLSDYIKMGVVETWNGTTAYADRAAARAEVTTAGNIATYTKSGAMFAGADALTFAIVAFMPEEVGNVANYKTGTTAPSIEMGVKLVATQLASEEDSFDALYDFDATFDDGSTVPSSGSDSKEIATDTDVSVATKLETPIATVEIPSGAINAGAEGGNVELNIKPANSLPAGLSVNSTQEAMPYDISLEKTGTVSIAEDTIFNATIYVGIGRTGVKIYHYSNALNDVGTAEALAAVTTLTGANANGAFYYDTASGWAHLKVNSFSPYTVLYTPADTGFFSGGNGSTLYPYLMSNEQDMLDFLHYSRVMYGQEAAEADKADLYEMLFYRACYKMTNDITVTTPVRNFGGSQCLFDGNGHTLTATFTSESDLGLYNGVGFLNGFNGSSSTYIYEATTEAERNSDYAYTINGKTYMLTAGTIRDLTIEGSVYSKLSSAASVVGGVSTGYIINVTNKANITVEAPGNFVGGITVQTKGTGLVMDCKNYGTITCTGGTSPVGGISGSIYGGSGGQYPDIGNPYSASVLNCENHGAISAPDAGDVGGIVGQTHGYDAGYKKAIVNCKNTADVTGGTNVGGIIGRNPSSGITICLLNNTNSGKVNGTNTGDIIGVNEGNLVISAKNLNEINSALGKAGNITIELLDDITVNAPIVNISGKNITIDGNGKTVSFDHGNTLRSLFGNDTNPLYAGTLTVKNATFVDTNEGNATSPVTGFVAQTGYNSTASVTCENCTFKNLWCAVYLNPGSGNLVIKNCTYENCKYGYSKDHGTYAVTFEGNTEIDNEIFDN